MPTEETRRQASLLKTGALQSAILNSANFSSIATDEKGVMPIFNFGAERMLGYAASDVINKATPADISDPEEVFARAEELTKEFSTVIPTSSQEQSDIVASYNLVVNSYIVKPVDFERFAEAVGTLGLYWLLPNQRPNSG